MPTTLLPQSTRLSFPKLNAGRRYGARAAVLGLVTALLMLTAVTAQASPGWSLVTSPNKGSTSELSGVSCSTQSLCLAVGTYGSGSSEKTLSEKWNGSKVGVVTSPTPSGSKYTDFNAISCPTSSFCMAVGRVYKSGSDLMLAEDWNGSKWTQLTTPSLGVDQSDDLYGVSCKSATWCMAVGWWTIDPENALAMLWNGSTWTQETVPNTNSTDDNDLYSVSCVATSFCIAVGATSGDDQLIDRWNGTTWAIVSSTANLALDGVRCRSTTFCVAVGAQGSSTIDTLVETWNGATWTVTSSPNVSGSNANFLASVSCTGTTFCMAGGYYFSSGGAVLTLTEVWTGGTWSIVPSINPNATQNDITSVSCTTAPGGNFCLAVGWDGSSLTLVEKYSS
jgi:hypothetical protein